jgi:hypothetical protein
LTHEKTPLRPRSLFVLILGMETQAMSDNTIAIPPLPRRSLPELRGPLLARPAVHGMSELREACLAGGFALAVCWVAAELAVAFGIG